MGICPMDFLVMDHPRMFLMILDHRMMHPMDHPLKMQMPCHLLSTKEPSLSSPTIQKFSVLKLWRNNNFLRKERLLDFPKTKAKRGFPLRAPSTETATKFKFESSMEIPNTILKMSAVLGFSGIPKNPIIPAVIISGIIFGMIEMIIILTFLNSMAMINAITKKAMIMEGGRIVLEGPSAELRENADVKEFYLVVTHGGGRKNYRDVKHYRRRKRWLS